MTSWITEKCVHCVPKNPTNDDEAHCMGLSRIHLTCYSDQESSFGAETWLITQHLKHRKRMHDVETVIISPPSKENGSIIISKEDNGKLSWDLDFLDNADIIC